MLSKNKTIKLLKNHNAWRRGADIEMMEPKKIGEVIDSAIKYLQDSNNKKDREMSNLIKHAKKRIRA